MYSLKYNISESLGKEISDFLFKHAMFEYDGSLPFVWVIGSSDNIIVFICALYINTDLISIYNVCTHTDYRRKGILAGAILFISETFPLKKLWLGVELWNENVLTIYEKLGFIRKGVTDLVPLYGFIGRRVHSLFLERNQSPHP